MKDMLPETCQRTLEAIQADPLELSSALEEHCAQCPSCQEARVQWLAMEDAPSPLVPASYYEALPDRILRKLPARTARRFRGRPLLVAAAALLVLAAGVGGYWAGRTTPQAAPATAALPDTEVIEALPVAPFEESDDPLAQVGNLSSQEAATVARKLAEQQHLSRISNETQP
nr:hypothetical protein [uncultured Holophaga sp.]